MDRSNTHSNENKSSLVDTSERADESESKNGGPNTAKPPSSGNENTKETNNGDNSTDALPNSSPLVSLAPKPSTPAPKSAQTKCPSDGGSKSIAQTKWEQMLKHLLDFKEKHGHCLVPNRYPENPQLGSWVSTQRRQYKTLQASMDTPMTHERAKILEDIGFVWQTRDPRHVPWEKRYEELCNYKNKYGNCLVPIGYKDNVQLSNWVSTQRQEYKLMKDGKPSRLTPDRILLLNRVGFIWEAQRGGPRRKRSRREIAQDVWDNLVPASENSSETVSSSMSGHLFSVGPSSPTPVLSSDMYQVQPHGMGMNPEMVTSEPIHKLQRCESGVTSPLAHHSIPLEDTATPKPVPLLVTSGEHFSHPENCTARLVSDEPATNDLAYTERGVYGNISQFVTGAPDTHPLRVVSNESIASSGQATGQDLFPVDLHSRQIACPRTITVQDDDIFADADEDDEHNTMRRVVLPYVGQHKDQSDATEALLSLGAL